MGTLTYILCFTFLVWLVTGMALKTLTPFREVMYRLRIRPRPQPPPPQYDRFDLEL